MRTRRHISSTIGLYIIFVAVFIMVVYPLVWMLYSSFKPQWEIFENPFSLPNKLFLGNYVKVFTRGNFGTYFINSILVTVPSVIGIVFFSSLAGYAFARFKFRGDKIVFFFFLIGIIIPVQSIIIPSFQIVSKLGLMDTYWALIFTYFSWGQVAILILRAFFRSLPQEIIESAKMDGCSELQVFFRIALPLAKPAVATVAIFYFVWVWNNFLYPLLYVTSDEMNTIPLGIMLFRGKYSVDWGAQCAALSIATIPAVVFYLLFQDKFVRGLTAGAVKG